MCIYFTYILENQSQICLAHTHTHWKHDAQTVVAHDSSALILRHFFLSLSVFFFPSGKQSYSSTHTSPDKLRIKFSSVVIYWSLFVQSLLENLISQNKRRRTKPHRLHAVVNPSPASTSKHI